MDRKGINIGGKQISNLRYADDTALFATNHQDATDIVDSLNKKGQDKHLQLNAKKTKHMHIGQQQSQQLIVNGEQLEMVTDFKYLGSIKTNTADCTKDINSRIGIAKRKMIELNNIWKDRTLSNVLKLKILKSLIFTVITYGAEGWTIKQKEEKKINAAEMWFYRRLLRVSWKERRTNISILKELNIKRQLLPAIIEKKMSFFGHTSRNRKCSITKDIIQGKVEGRRKRGRPRAAYMDNIKKWSNTTTPEAFRKAEDREVWRQLTKKAARSASDNVDAG